MNRGKKQARQKITWKEIKRQKVLLIWSAFFVIHGFIFYYLPLGGWIMAFQNYKPRDGMLHSKFIGLDKFKFLFSDASFIRVIRNTLAMGTINLVTSFIMAILFAILLNEVKNVLGKKLVQTISYLPHFLSWIIVTGILHDALSSTGIVNEMLQKLGIIDSQINFFAHEAYFWPIVAFSNLWKETGWNAIIYLAAITAIDPCLYEAASIDGAGQRAAVERLQYFLGVTRRENPFMTYKIDGEVIDQPALHPVGMLAATAQGTLAIPERLDGAELSETGKLAKEWTERFFREPMRKGERRYYDNCLYLFAYLALSGNYRIW